MKKSIFAGLILLLFLWAGPPPARAETYTGTGIYPGFRDGYITVRVLYNNSPASSAGVRVGDRILLINDRMDFIRMNPRQIATLLNPPLGSSVKITVKRNGGVKDFIVKSASMNLDASTLPDSDIGRGRVASVGHGSFFISSFTARDQIRADDMFYVTHGSRILGTANARGLNEGKVMMRFTGDADSLRDLSRATLLFYQPAGFIGDYSDKLKNPALDLPPDRGGIAASSKPGIQPGEDRLVQEYSNRKDMKQAIGKVVRHDRKNRTITLEVVVGATSLAVPGTSPKTQVITRYKNITVHYQGTVPVVPKVPVARISQNQRIKYFYQERGGKTYATLLQIMD